MNRITDTLVVILLGAVLLGLPASVTAQTALLEVDAGAGGEVKLMQVNDDGGLVALGTEGQGVIPARGPGARLMWYPGKAAFRVGAIVGTLWDDANVGRASMAMGANTTASGEGSTALGILTVARGRASTAMGDVAQAIGTASTAMGSNVTASGPSSTAMGDRTAASGLRSTAMGFNTRAEGIESTALGGGTYASGDLSTAMGSETKAVGTRSTAMGNSAVAFGKGSFAYGDASTTAVISALNDEFVVRASGGFRFRTSPTLNTGCDLPAGSGTFACTSSRLAKEGFEDLDGETVLRKLAGIPIQRWRYLGTRTSHVGPTAEDFHAAFGLGQGPTTISTVDADGISLLAVQALERRTAELREENADLRRRLEAIEAERAAERK